MRNLIIRLQNKVIRMLASKNNHNVVEEEKPSKQAIRVIPWFRDNGDKTHRLNYDLNKNSVVFDLGGYEGEWSSEIYCLYGSAIYIFEPYDSYFEKIKGRFLHNKDVHVFQFGLSNSNYNAQLSIADNSSSMFRKGENSVEIKLKDASEFLRNNKIEGIDLMKINIEGGEFDLLEHLIVTGDVRKIKNIQVQFHDFVPNAEQRMKSIQINLQKTHELTYQYEFVWENWRLK
jgi:FkbM family methyltransferase